MTAIKEQMIVSAGEQGTTTKAAAEARRDDSSLPAPLLSALGWMAIKVEQHFGGVPQDIEWAVANGKLWLLQSRPITNLPPAPLKDVRWDAPPGGQLIRREEVTEVSSQLRTRLLEMMRGVSLAAALPSLKAEKPGEQARQRRISV